MAIFRLCVALALLGGLIQAFWPGVTAAQETPPNEILFISERDGEPAIFIMNADGSGVRRLSPFGLPAHAPVWSPDRQKIAFVGIARGNGPEIYVMNADGTIPVRLTENNIEEDAPAWSPDGRYIAFTTTRDGNKEIYIMGANGSDPRNLTNHPGQDDNPAWSPAGTAIAFTSDRTGTQNLYLMDVDGGNVRRLTQNEDDIETEPAWSPDGSRLAFVLLRRDGGGIYTMSADGSDRQPVARTNSFDATPAWSGDGAQLAFVSYRDADYEIYSVSLDGSTAPANLTASPGLDAAPHWSPVERAFCIVTARGGINLRGGPGTDNPVVGGMALGQTAQATGQTTGADGFTWYRLLDGAWAREDVVTAAPDCASLPEVAD
ncbi:MAG: hypothetical protein GXY36_02295 [Chloroflexi bacterium]|nr:hypothetical protein [Chloroflexota bacterium]